MNNTETKRLRLQRLIGLDDTKGVRGDLARAQACAAAGHTKVGFLSTRLPAGEARHRLLRLAQRGAEVCHKHRARNLALISDTAAAALVELAIAESRAAAAERSLAAAQVRIDDLKSKLRAESFDEPTRRSDDELTDQLRRRSRTDIKVAG